MRGKVNSEGVEGEKEDQTFKRDTKRGGENRRALVMLQRWEMSKERIRCNSRCYVSQAYFVLKTIM